MAFRLGKISRFSAVNLLSARVSSDKKKIMFFAIDAAHAYDFIPAREVCA
jgi:hypothetical protein